MKIIDLTQVLYDGMPVYPGDPEVEIKQMHTLENEGWRLKIISVSSHIGTHVNVPSHMVENGKTMDSIGLDSYLGKCEVYSENTKMSSEKGILFRNTNITQRILVDLLKNKPKFVGLSEEFEFDIEIEKKLLEAEIISFENLANLNSIPNTSFQFYGVPLKIKEGDGSPVRAFAVLNK